MGLGSLSCLLFLCLACHGGVVSNAVALSGGLADAECPEVADSASQDHEACSLLQTHGANRRLDVKDSNTRSGDIGARGCCQFEFASTRQGARDCCHLLPKNAQPQGYALLQEPQGGSDRDQNWTGLAEPLVLPIAGLEVASPGIQHMVAASETMPHDALQRAIQRDRVSFKVRDVAPAEPHVDVVVTWHCETLGWLKDISPKLAPVITVVLLHKINPDEKCNETIPEVPLTLVEVQMPNRGRDVHSQFSYVSNNYDVLPTYTMFLQADHHWFIDGWNTQAHSFKSNGHAVNDLVALALQGRKSFYPVSPYISGHPVLFVDRESNIDKEAQDANKGPYLAKFDACYLDMFNQARDTVRSIFGGNPCDQPEVVFVPGFQYLASRENILARPREVWASLGDMSLACVAATYGIERLGIKLFGETSPTLDPNTWKLPNYCDNTGPVDPEKKYFKDPPDIVSNSEFWRKKWGCEPLSSFVQNRTNNSGAART